VVFYYQTLSQYHLQQYIHQDCPLVGEYPLKHRLSQKLFFHL